MGTVAPSHSQRIACTSSQVFWVRAGKRHDYMIQQIPISQQSQAPWPHGPMLSASMSRILVAAHQSPPPRCPLRCPPPPHCQAPMVLANPHCQTKKNPPARLLNYTFGVVGMEIGLQQFIVGTTCRISTCDGCQVQNIWWKSEGIHSLQNPCWNFRRAVQHGPFKVVVEPALSYPLISILAGIMMNRNVHECNVSVCFSRLFFTEKNMSSWTMLFVMFHISLSSSSWFLCHVQQHHKCIMSRQRRWRSPISALARTSRCMA